MTRPRIAAVTIGQTPRQDLLEALAARAGDGPDIVEYGALDGLTAERLPSAERPAYPLSTRMRDGMRVTLDEAALAPLVQQAIDRAEGAGADVTLLLCAGGFLDTTARGTLVRPFDAAVERLREIGALRIVVVVPFAGQVVPSRAKWQDAGFDVAVVVADPATLDASEAVRDAIVLDYVGHPARDLAALRARTGVPVIDLGECGAEAAIAALAALAGHGASERVATR